MWVLYVVVDWFVIAIHLPVGRYRQLVPTACIEAWLEEVEWAQLWLAHKVELPCAVEGHVTVVHRLGPRCSVVLLVGKHLLHVVIWHVCRNATLLVLGEHCLVLPVRCVDFWLLDLSKGEPCCRIGRVLLNEHHLSLLECVHCTLFAGRCDEVHTLLLCYRLKVELCVVPHTGSRWPLEQIVDCWVATAIVKVCAIECILYSKCEEVDGLDAPVLSSVAANGVLAHDSCIVLA